MMRRTMEYGGWRHRQALKTMNFIVWDVGSNLRASFRIRFVLRLISLGILHPTGGREGA